MEGNNDKRSLLDAFKELEQSKDMQVENYKKEKQIENNVKQAEKSDSFLFHVKNRKLRDNLILILVVLVVLFALGFYSSRYVFATDLVVTEIKSPIGVYEANETENDVYEVISQNISTTYQKQVIEVEEEIKYETERIDNKNLPKDEEYVEQEGKIGHKNVTYVRTYEDGTISEEKIIGTDILEEPVTEKIQVGTSKGLADLKIHVGDKLYAESKLELKKEASESASSIAFVKELYDVDTLEVVNDTWIKVLYDNKTGYLKFKDLTSEAVTPGIAESSRKQKIADTVYEEMPLNTPSTLTLDDFKHVFVENANDTKGVFGKNYKAFYDAEYEYNINGVFLASIAIHESGWGTSTIAVNKKNLFGYGAYDGTPYESAVTFDSYAECIDTVARWLAINYLNEEGTELPNGEIATGRYYETPTVSGVNKHYASDDNWATKVYSFMQEIYDSI